MPQLQIIPLHPSLGAEVAGIDLSKPIDAPTRQALAQALFPLIGLIWHRNGQRPAEQWHRDTASRLAGPEVAICVGEQALEG